MCGLGLEVDGATGTIAGRKRAGAPTAASSPRCAIAAARRGRCCTPGTSTALPRRGLRAAAGAVRRLRGPESRSATARSSASTPPPSGSSAYRRPETIRALRHERPPIPASRTRSRLGPDRRCGPVAGADVLPTAACDQPAAVGCARRLHGVRDVRHVRVRRLGEERCRDAKGLSPTRPTSRRAANVSLAVSGRRRTGRELGDQLPFFPATALCSCVLVIFDRPSTLSFLASA